jgi:hypothetical protein
MRRNPTVDHREETADLAGQAIDLGGNRRDAGQATSCAGSRQPRYRTSALALGEVFAAPAWSWIDIMA